ncbi:MAG TPA: AIR synthase related protein, partial [Thermomicrobiales bacterium]|nr:AIR synthase related protein [Thermomicrobiales bacterium]
MPEIWSLEVRWLNEALDPGARPLRAALAAAELPLAGARHRRLYLIDAPHTPELVAAAGRLCADPLLAKTHDGDATATAPGWTIDVLPLPGVTDAEGDSLAAALAGDGFGEARVRAGRRYLLPPGLPAEAAASIARRLGHPVVEQVNVYPASNPPPPSRWGAAFVATTAEAGDAEIVPIRELDDAALATMSRERLLALPVADMVAIRDHFRSLGREPSDVELETIAQTWSEHCAHRTFKATIVHRESGAGPVEIRGLLRTCIAAATAEAARPWVRSAFVDNAGAIAFDRNWDVAFKVETHNHPSAIEPFGGANTGVGGVVRDILGVSAEPIANTDVLCFGPLDLPAAALLPNALPPREIYEGVVAGIADYGNKMGIPTVNGATLFDAGYAANPLVFCGTVGLAPRDRHPAAPQPGDLIVVAGGRAGRDGIHGATFSSTVIDAADAPALG